MGDRGSQAVHDVGLSSDRQRVADHEYPVVAQPGVTGPQWRQAFAAAARAAAALRRRPSRRQPSPRLPLARCGGIDGAGVVAACAGAPARPTTAEAAIKEAPTAVSLNRLARRRVELGNMGGETNHRGTSLHPRWGLSTWMSRPESRMCATPQRLSLNLDSGGDRSHATLPKAYAA